MVKTFLETLSTETCTGLLRHSVLGRIGVVVDGRPEIFPVNHVYDEVTGSVTFPTNERTKLHAALSWPYISFEVDGLDPDGRGGWSVLVVGHAEEVTEPSDRGRLNARRLPLWAGGSERVWLRIVPEKVTGRRISATI
jgi:uncharacterized protein